MRQDELYHHGIKGMKWGIRRYQNADGSLTSAGKKRRKLSDKQKKTIKTAIKVGAIAAGVTLAAYGAYRLNQKSMAALIDSYSSIGDTFANFAVNDYDLSYSKLVSSEHRPSDVSSYSAQYYKKLGGIDQWIADELHNKAKSRSFDGRERLDAAVKMLTKGSKSFKQSKARELLEVSKDKRNSYL